MSFLLLKSESKLAISNIFNSFIILRDIESTKDIVPSYLSNVFIMLQDYSYILKGNLNNSDDLIMIKIPMEIEDEFESKYNVYDLLIGHLSVIGIYKGIVKENFVKTNIFSYFANMDPTQNLIKDTKVKPSSSAQVKDLKRKDTSSISNSENNFHFIDVIALIQDVEFEQQTDGIINEVSVNLPWYKRIFNLFFRRHE